jgi:hypothetical protein
MKNLNRVNRTHQKIDIHPVITNINKGESSKFRMIFASYDNNKNC